MPVLPILSVLACVWLMINLTAITWVRFLIWMALGVVLYYAYGRRHSLVGARGGQLIHEELRATFEAEEDLLDVGRKQPEEGVTRADSGDELRRPGRAERDDPDHRSGP